MCEHTPYNQKNKQLTSFKKNFQQDETESFGKWELNLGSKAESEAISCSATAKAEINTNLQNPKTYLEVEAAESARAFMEDTFSIPGVQINAAQTFSGRLDKNLQNKTFGKRHFEENNSLGECFILHMFNSMFLHVFEVLGVFLHFMLIFRSQRHSSSFSRCQ